MDIQNYYEEFIAKLQEIFMMDHAELDFGIYRIMNQKRDDIMDFLENRLLKQVGSSLDIDEKEVEKLQKRQKEILQMAGGDISVLPPAIPLRQEYDANEEQLRRMGNPEELRNEVFSHLVTFFSRYYDGGDFLSKRRYKGDTYVIPYNGEEVKLHWANSDQYYIKTSEYFRDYTFELPQSHRKVHFVLKDVSTELNNNKSDKGKESRFALYESEDKEEKVMEVAENGDLNIYFTYELWPKATKQEELVTDAIEKISTSLPADFQELVTTILPLPKKPNRTLLEKHLTDYTAKNSFDYFIHKNLGAFLKRELDFYLKNEVINIDDLDDINIKKRLGVAKAIKNVGVKIIQMLAQLEDFQKKLWLKKKFVVQSDYCITLDCVSECLYSDIIANEAQRKEWVRLFAIDEIKGDLMKEGYSEPLTIEFLKQNPYLVLDTAFFDAKFKHKLIASMENIDEQMNGLLINSENFQALQLLQEKYNRSIIGTYYDPPYNTKKNEFVYKDSFKHSSWLTMMNDRLSLTRELMKREGAIFISSDENENTNLRLLGNQVFGDDNYLADIIWQGGAKNDQKYFSISHEYISAFLKDKAFMDESELRWVERKPRLDFIYDAFEKIKKLYPNDYKRQEKEIKKWFKGLPDSEPAKRQKHYSCVEARGLFFPDNISKPENGYYYDVIHPVTGKPCKKPKGGWRYIEETMKQQLDDDRILFGKDETTVPCRKSFLKETEYESPNSVIYLDNRVSTAFMKNLFDNKDIFDNPKYYLLIAKILKIMGDKNSYYLDLFGGSGTTAHAIMELNKQDDGCRKYVLGEMADYFERVTKPRIEKIIYSENWKDGKPVSRKGISQCFKYIRLEQYEDTLNNLKPKKQELEFEDDFKDGYMLNYLLDTEYRESLLDIKMFFNPFNNELNITRNNEQIPTKVDMVDTFNYLIGLNVEKERWFDDDNICIVMGETHRDHLRTVVLWRNQEKVDNAKLAEWFEKPELRDLVMDADIIYVNGENTLQSKIHEDENWQIMLTDEEFLNRMFEEE